MPKGMRVMAERLGAFTRNRFRIENAGSNTCLPGQIITVTLPSNTLVDLHSLRMHGQFQALGGGMENSKGSKEFTDSDKDSFALKPVAPDDFHQLISRLSVSANGTAIQQGCMEYNTITAIKSLMDGSAMQNRSTRSTITPNEKPAPATNAAMLRYFPTKEHLQKGRVTGLKEMYYPTDASTQQVQLGITDFFKHDGTTDNKAATFKPVQGGAWENYDVANETLASLSDGEKGVGLQCTDFQLHNWRGYLGESSVRYLPTDLVGAIQIQLTMADANILPIFGRGPGGALYRGDHHAFYGTSKESNGSRDLSKVKPFTYMIKNIYWTIDTLSVDGPYGDMLRGKIAEKGYISLLFKEYYVFNKSGVDGTSGTGTQHRFSLATGSMDKIYSVIRRNDYNSTNHPVSSTFESTITGDPNWYTPMTQFIMPSLRFFNYGRSFLLTMDKNLADDDYNEPIADGNPSFDVAAQFQFRPHFHFERESDFKYDYKINSVMHPQFEASTREAIFDTAYSHDMQPRPHGLGNTIYSRQEWFEQKAVVPLVLNLTDGPLQLMSGYDSRGHSSFVEYNVKGLHRENYKKLVNNSKDNDQYSDIHDNTEVVDKYDSFTVTSVVETTSELRIGAGLSLVIAR